MLNRAKKRHLSNLSLVFQLPTKHLFPPSLEFNEPGNIGMPGSTCFLLKCQPYRTIPMTGNEQAGEIISLLHAIRDSIYFHRRASLLGYVTMLSAVGCRTRLSFNIFYRQAIYNILILNQADSITNNSRNDDSSSNLQQHYSYERRGSDGDDDAI